VFSSFSIKPQRATSAKGPKHGDDQGEHAESANVNAGLGAAVEQESSAASALAPLAESFGEKPVARPGVNSAADARNIANNSLSQKPI